MDALTMRQANPHTAPGRGFGVAALVAAYVLLVAGVYEYVVSPRFSYLAFTSINPRVAYLLVDAVLCGVLALLLPRTVLRPSDLGRIIVFFVVTVPGVLIPTFIDSSWSVQAVEAKLYSVLAFLVLTAVLRIFPRDAWSALSLRGDSALYVLLGVAFIAVAVLGSTYGFSLQLHSLASVYDQREIYSEGGGGRGLVGFATGLLQNALAPLFLAAGMYRRSFAWSAAGALLFIFVYSITGVKSALVGMLFVIIVYALARRTRPVTFTRGWSIGVIVFVALAWVGSSLAILSVAIDLVVRRILVMQGLLTYHYIGIFRSDEPTYFSHTVFGSFVQRPFEGVPPQIVGEILFGRSVHANASFVADGFVSGRLIGVLIAAVGVSVFLALLDILTSSLAPPLALASTCMGIYITTQSGVVTALINHGGIALLASLWIAGMALGRHDRTSRDEVFLPSGGQG